MLIDLDRTTVVTQKSRVMVVDNDALVRLGTVVMLREMGYAPTSASAADEAIASVASDGTLDILVTDYAMPGGTGVSLARRLMAGNKALRVAIVTGHDRIYEPLEPEWQVLQKPFTSEELRDVMTALELLP